MTVTVQASGLPVCDCATVTPGPRRRALAVALAMPGKSRSAQSESESRWPRRTIRSIMRWATGSRGVCLAQQY
jgi:hypothetical protein